MSNSGTQTFQERGQEQPRRDSLTTGTTSDLTERLAQIQARYSAKHPPKPTVPREYVPRQVSTTTSKPSKPVLFQPIGTIAKEVLRERDTPFAKINAWTGGKSHVSDTIREWHKVAPEVQSAITAAENGQTAWPLVFTGDPGGGKTCAALCAYDRNGGQWYAFADLCEKIIDAQQGQLHDHLGYRITPRMIWEEWRTSRLGLLDDIGTKTRVTDHQYETLKRALDVRETKPLIVTTNLQLSVIATVFDDRIASRLGGGTVIEFKGDRRVG